jgi:hypothetical protein
MIEAFMTELEAALARKAASDELVAVLRRHRDAGLSQRAAYDSLQTLRSREIGEPDEDRILELMDIVSGFCHPACRLWDDQLTT